MQKITRALCFFTVGFERGKNLSSSSSGQVPDNLWFVLRCFSKLNSNRIQDQACIFLLPPTSVKKSKSQ